MFAIVLTAAFLGQLVARIWFPRSKCETPIGTRRSKQAGIARGLTFGEGSKAHSMQQLRGSVAGRISHCAHGAPRHLDGPAQPRGLQRAVRRRVGSRGEDEG